MTPIRLAVLTSSNFRALHRLDGRRDIERVDSVADADVVLISPRHGSALRDAWRTMTHVRWIHSLGAGVEMLPFDLLRQSKIVVTNARGVYADALGEFAIAAMLWFAKGLRRLVNNQAAHKWEPYTVERLEGTTAGIIGFGGIGRAVAKRVVAMGMRVVATRETPIDELIPQSDYVVLSLPLTGETRNLIDAARIGRMKSKAVLINVSRGSIVDEQALINALREHRIRGAALDVFATEPLPPGHPLWSLDNVLISPHTADRTGDSHDRAMDFFLKNLEHFRRGEPLENVVDLAREY